jgi:hypothetical protein
MSKMLVPKESLDPNLRLLHLDTTLSLYVVSLTVFQSTIQEKIFFLD